jgi:epoxyqueuosine reductase
LLGDVVRLGGDGTIARAFVDAGPVPERELAQRAGLGWIGKNTMLIDPRRGSFLFIASILTDADLVVDSSFESDRCGSCRACLDACPTDAFVTERVLDSRRCISYLTIEHRGEIEARLASQMDGWVFGCDVCQDVCPWNHKFAAPSDDSTLGYDPQLASLDLTELVEMSDDEFDRRFQWTPMERPGAEGMRRNARIALQSRE